MFRRELPGGIELRQFRVEDAETIFGIVDAQRAYLREWLPWVDLTESPVQVREFIVRSVAQEEEGSGPSAGIWLEGALVGSVGCHPIDHANRSCSLGYWLAAGLQGKGIVSRCTAAMVDYLFKLRELHRVEIRCGTGNERSCAIPKRLGFRLDGTLREAEWVNDRWIDLYVWSMLESEWRK